MIVGKSALVVLEPMPEAAIRYYFHDIKMMVGEAFLVLAIANDEQQS